MKKSSLVAILMILLGSAYAQRGFDRSEMVAREKEMVMSKITDLSADQKMLMDGIYDEYGVTLNETIDEIRKSRDYSQFRTKIPALQKEKDLLIKDVLNAEQYVTYEKVTKSGGLGFGGGRRQRDNDDSENQEVSNAVEDAPRAPRFDPAEMINNEKALVMSKITDLSDEQKTKIDGIYEEYTASVSNMIEEMRNSGERGQFREKMPVLQKEKDSNINEVLTSEQYVIYEEITSQNRFEGPGGRGRGQGGRNQSPDSTQETP